jgi:hypothetical protein
MTIAITEKNIIKGIMNFCNLIISPPKPIYNMILILADYDYIS